MDAGAWIRSWFGGPTPAEQASDEMLRLQFDNLELRFRTIDPNTLADDGDRRFFDELAAIFARQGEPPRTDAGRAEAKPAAAAPAPMTWDEAYRLESQIAMLLRGDRLRQEIAGRLRWALAEGVREAVVLQADYVALLKFIEEKKLAEADGVLRDFLLQVMEAVHWHSKRKYLARKVRVRATRNTLIVGLIVLVLVLWPYFVLPAVVVSGVRPAVLTLASLELAQATPPALFRGGGAWAHFALYTALTCGLLGAVFSRLITLQTQWSAMALEELYNARAFHYILLRAGVGMCGALIVFFFLQSGLVSGTVFPDFKKLTLELVPFGTDAFKSSTRLVLPSANLALLIMWSFIAGFSESLVPSVLANTERQFGGGLSARP